MIDEAVAGQFGRGGGFVTAVLAELDLATGPCGTSTQATYHRW